MQKIKAVLFDMDGLMIDSEPLHLMAFNLVFEKYGKHLTEEENTKRYVGISDADGTKDMVARFNLPITAGELSSAKAVAYRKLLENELTAQPGLIDLLKILRKHGYKTAIGSSSTVQEIKVVVTGLGVPSLINEYVSAENVKHGKPAPDIYLECAKTLGVDPSECLVLEDAPKGVEAGKAAGMRVFAIPSQYTKGENFSFADKVLNSLDEVSKELKP